MAINKFTNDISIIGGFGHVGLPLGIMLASKNLKVSLNDINKDSFDIISKAKMPFIEYGAQPILKKVINNKKLSLTLDINKIRESQFIIIAIGTPIDEYMSPKFDNFLNFILSIKNILVPNQIIIIRSSVYPEVYSKVKKILPNFLKKNLLYCPERIQQGYAIQELKKLPQIVSGENKNTIELGSKLFKKISKKIIVTSVKEAELVKLFSNSYRYVQFALANQFYMMCEKSGVSYDNVRKFMTDSYSRATGLPSAGFAAGPCLLKDTMQLSSFYNSSFSIGQMAMTVNEGLPSFIVDQLSLKYKLNNLKVGVLGMSFKANVDDKRDSLSFKLCKLLKFEGANVIMSDEHMINNNFKSAKETIDKSKIIIIGCPHKAYKKIKISKNKILIDPWNFVNKA